MRSIAPCLALITFGDLASPTTQAQAPPEMASVQIVNATSVPVLSLKVNDTLAYDTFPQGKRSGDAPVPLLEAVYEAEDKQSGSKAKVREDHLRAWRHQSLVILGDFSTHIASQGHPKAAGQSTSERGSKHPPNVLFQVYPHTPLESAGETANHQRRARQKLDVCNGNE